MPRILSKIRIDEVSAVTHGAGEDCRILLMKRDDTPRSKPHVERHARRLRKLQESERDRPRSFNEIIKAMADRDDASGDLIRPPAATHHASTVADLLVEAGSFPHRAAALQHLLHKPSGQALLTRMSKAADQTAKETSMDKIETVRDVVKRHGIVAVAKSIVSENRSYGITEHEFVALATEHAKAQHPDLTDAAAFAKLYQIPEVWRACELLKSMPFLANVEPLVVGGADTRDLSDQSTAIAQLKQLGARKWPTASEAQQFANAFTDPVNRELAAKAHVRPVAPAGGIFPYPR
jgi:hypothetical protein